MTKATIAGGALAAVLALTALAVGRAPEQHTGAVGAPSSAASPSIADSPEAPALTATAAAAETADSPATAEAHEGLIYGRVTMDDGDVYEGRIRWGGDEEALWGNYFNGFKSENAWVARAPREQLPTRLLSLEVFGIQLAAWERPTDLGRPFMARFGDIALIEPHGRRIRVTLKSGTVVDLDRFSADDVADGVRVWDGRRGVVDLGEWRIRSIELIPTPRLGAVPDPLHGTVRTSEGDFTGFLQWDREETVGPDELEGHTADGALGSVPFSAIRSIARRSSRSVQVTLLDGREIVLSDTRAVGDGNRGIYVDDRRYGRVLVSWSAFERVDFSPGGAAPAYGDFPPGHQLTGSVLTRSGRHLAGRLVYDLDESETTETLDAPWQGVDYTIPFGLIASIEAPAPDESPGQPVGLTLHSGEELQLEHAGDLGAGNAGILIFVDDRGRAEYVPWAEVDRVDLERPEAH